jgi:hypothetical protein
MTHLDPDSPTTDPIGDPPSASGSPILWAIYLGMSWTWIIGMFLPVLLVRDYGVWAWVIFAIPNCLGAAAMGWVMKTRRQSVAFVQDHATAGRVFSLVTIAFHLFVTAWLCPRLVGNAGWIVPIVLVQLAFTPMLRGAGQLTASVLTFVASCVIAIGLFNNGGLTPPPEGVMSFGSGEMVGLSLVCLLGFLLCPYLDLTFHRARQQTTDAGAKVAFGLGFCVFFASMIVLTLFYAGSMLSATKTVANLLVAQLAIQAALTVALHARVLHDQAQARDDASDLRAGVGFALAVGLLGAMAGFFAESWGQSYAGLTVSEIVYRCFMSFYGLAVPAYAFTSFKRRGARWVATSIIIVIAMPFYWLAFVERQMSWAIVGGAVVVIGGVLTQFAPARARTEH